MAALFTPRINFKPLDEFTVIDPLSCEEFFGFLGESLALAADAYKLKEYQLSRFD
jgi:hypothetical protein